MEVGPFAMAVLALRTIFGGSVTSWGRTPEHNARVGGVANSPHLVDLGADVVWTTPPPLDVLAKEAERRGLRVIREQDHDHFQPLEWGAP